MTKVAEEDYSFDPATVVGSVAELNECYGQPSARSLVKEVDFIHPLYQSLIEASPFVVVASVGPEGLDVSPRGDAPGFVTVVNERCLMLPDRKGNNRADTLTNIVRDPRVSLIFLIPGVGETLRVIGKAQIVTDHSLCEKFAVKEKLPRSVMVVGVEKVYFQCQKAVARSGLWSQDAQIDRTTLPTAGALIKAFDHDFDAQSYDAGYAEYLAETMY